MLNKPRVDLLYRYSCSSRYSSRLAGHGVVQGHVSLHGEVVHVSSQLRGPLHSLHNGDGPQPGEQVDVIVTQST